MAKIEIMLLQDLHVGIWIKHKLCTELLFVLEKHKNSSKESEKKQVKRRKE